MIEVEHVSTEILYGEKMFQVEHVSTVNLYCYHMFQVEHVACLDTLQYLLRCNSVGDSSSSQQIQWY